MSFSHVEKVTDQSSSQRAPAPCPHVENRLWKLAKKIINFIVNIFLGIFSFNSTPVLASHTPVLASHTPVLAFPTPIRPPFRLIDLKIDDILHSHQNGVESIGCGLIQLRLYALDKSYSDIRSEHYDWWMFPTDRSSSLGTKFQLSSEHFRKLAANQAFMKNYKEGIQIVLEAISSPSQIWNGYGVRLAKMANSLKLFIANSSGDQRRELESVYESVQQFYQVVVLPKHLSHQMKCSDFDWVTHYCEN